MRITVIFAITVTMLGLLGMDTAGAAVIAAMPKPEHAFTFNPYRQIRWLELVFRPNSYLPMRRFKPVW
jgi:hypothetical protein